VTIHSFICDFLPGADYSDLSLIGHLFY
jgi:hypothetical protein